MLKVVKSDFYFFRPTVTGGLLSSECIMESKCCGKWGKCIVFVKLYMNPYILHQVYDRAKDAGKVGLGEMESMGIGFLNDQIFLKA